MAEIVYLLCALTSMFCAALLMRRYRRQRTRLLMWSTLCFVGLALNNTLLFVDLVLVPDIDLALIRTGTALGAMVLLVIGLIWEAS
jgi:hydrogenase/urease accessory protein HupE